MTVNVATLPETAAAPLALRAVPASISAAGVNDLVAIARQQMQLAVPAPALIAAYSTNVQAQSQIKNARPAAIANTVSSPLAAQFIAQLPNVNAQDLAIFAPSPNAAADIAQPPPEDDYITTLKIARGEVTLAKPATAATPPSPAQTSEAAPTQKPAPAEATARAGVAALAASLPALVVPFTRAPTLEKARGVAAYQLAQTRGTLARKQAEPAAVEN